MWSFGSCCDGSGALQCSNGAPDEVAAPALRARRDAAGPTGRATRHNALEVLRPEPARSVNAVIMVGGRQCFGGQGGCGVLGGVFTAEAPGRPGPGCRIKISRLTVGVFGNEGKRIVLWNLDSFYYYGFFYCYDSL